MNKLRMFEIFYFKVIHPPPPHSDLNSLGPTQTSKFCSLNFISSLHDSKKLCHISAEQNIMDDRDFEQTDLFWPTAVP